MDINVSKIAAGMCLFHASSDNNIFYEHFSFSYGFCRRHSCVSPACSSFSIRQSSVSDGNGNCSSAAEVGVTQLTENWWLLRQKKGDETGESQQSQ